MGSTRFVRLAHTFRPAAERLLLPTVSTGDIPLHDIIAAGIARRRGSTTGLPMSRVTVALFARGAALAVTGFLLWPAGTVQAVRAGSHPPEGDFSLTLVRTENLGPNVVTAFRWSNRHVAVVLSRPNGVLFSVRSVRDPEDVEAFAVSIPTAPNAVFPDVVHRADSGDLFWLNKQTRMIYRVSSTGDVQRRIRVDCMNPMYFTLDATGHSVVFCADAGDRPAEYIMYSPDGRLVHSVPGLLQRLETRTDPISVGVLFHFTSGGLKEGRRLELFTGFPHYRSHGDAIESSIRLNPCLSQNPALETNFRRDVEVNGWPPPLGKGRHRPGVPLLAHLALTATGGDIFGLLNGGVVARWRASSPIPACGRLPLERGVTSRWIVAGENWFVDLATVSDRRSSTLLRFWTVVESSNRTDGTFDEVEGR